MVAASRRSTTKRRWLTLLIPLVGLLALGLILHLMGDDTVHVNPPQASVADVEPDRHDEATRRLGQKTPSSTTTPTGAIDKDEAGGKPVLSEDADIILHLQLPQEWPVAVSCRLQLFPASSMRGAREAGGRVVEIEPGDGQRIAVNVPVNSIIRIMGSDILNIVSGVQREEDGNRFRFVTANRLKGVEGPRSYGTTATSTTLRESVVEKGAVHEVDVLPMVSIRAVLRDGNGTPLLTPSINWSMSWWMGPTEILGPVVDDSTGSRHDDRASAIWRVPAGANLSVFPDQRHGNVEPERSNVTVPTHQRTLTIDFLVPEVVIGRVRVIEFEGEPLSTAKLFPRITPDSDHRPSAMIRHAPTRRDEGVYAILLSNTPHKVIVGAPQYIHQVVDSRDIPTDGSALDVTLQRGQPLMVVRVDFDDVGDLERRRPVRLKVTTRSFPPDWRDHQSLQWFWRGEIDLPPQGRMEIHGQAGGTPRVEPISEHYDFELIERGHEGGLPLRRFLARPVTGVRVHLVDAEGLNWDRNRPAVVLITRAVPDDEAIMPEGTRPADHPTVPFYGIEPAKPIVKRLFPGTWVLRVWQDEPTQGGRVGRIEVTVNAGIEEVEVTPTIVDEEWIELRVNDLTRECHAAGTTFFAGHAPLVSMEDAREEAMRMAKWLAESKYPDATPEMGRVTRSYAAAALAAHRDGKLMAPRWLPERLLVMPKGKLAVYEGVVNWEARTVTVQRPSWACSVTFAPLAADVDERAPLTEAGWFVAIREYRDEKDPVTIKGVDTKVKVEASAGTASIESLPPGKYVAYYVRAGQHEEKDPETGETTIRTRLEWCDAATFELEPGHTQVTLPTVRSR